MNGKRLGAMILLLAFVGSTAVVIIRSISREPLYQGKPLSRWYEEYASVPNQSIHVWHDPTGRVLRDAKTGKRLPDPAGDALRALGPNAVVPYLVRRVRVSALEGSRYIRVYTNLPAIVRGKLPNPWMKARHRWRALEALGDWGEEAQAAAPALLEALKHTDPPTRVLIIQTLRKLHVDQSEIGGLMFDLGSQQRYADVVEIARHFGWHGRDMARLLGECLRASEPAVRRGAMSLLERSGTAAAPALDQVLLAMKDSDREVRWLAIRSVETNGDNTPRIVESLRAALADENQMVRTVARRALLKMAPETIPTVESEVGDTP